MDAQTSAREAWSLLESNPSMQEGEWEIVLRRMSPFEKRKLIAALIIGERHIGYTHLRSDIVFNTGDSSSMKEEFFAHYLATNLEYAINAFNKVTKDKGLTIDDIKEVSDE